MSNHRTNGVFVVALAFGLGALSCKDAASRPTFNVDKKQSDAKPAERDDRESSDLSSGNDKAPASKDPEVSPIDSNDSGKPKPEPTPTPEVTPAPIPEVKDPIQEKPTPMPGESAIICKDFSWEKISKPEEAVCFKSIDDVFASMPERVRSNWVMIRETRSVQPASLQKPRIVVMAPDGSFIVTAATDQEKSKDIEVAVYDYKKKVWDFAGIDYSQSPPKVERELCKTCHGAEPRPIWTSYPNWPSAYAGKTQRLTSEEAAILNEIASGKSTLPYVKHLKMARSYAADRILYPSSKYTGIENNQTLNVIIAIKAAKTFVGKLLQNPSMSEAKLLNIAGQVLCPAGVIKIDGFNIGKEFSHGIVGKDRDSAIWAGNAGGPYFVGLEILNIAYKNNPELKTKLPSITKLVETKQFAFYRTESLTEFFAAEDDLKGSWQAVDNTWFRNTFKPAFQSNSENCRLLLNY